MLWLSCLRKKLIKNPLKYLSLLLTQYIVVVVDIENLFNVSNCFQMSIYGNRYDEINYLYYLYKNSLHSPISAIIYLFIYFLFPNMLIGLFFCYQIFNFNAWKQHNFDKNRLRLYNVWRTLILIVAVSTSCDFLCHFDIELKPIIMQAIPICFCIKNSIDMVWSMEYECNNMIEKKLFSTARPGQTSPVRSISTFLWFDMRKIKCFVHLIILVVGEKSDTGPTTVINLKSLFPYA